MLLTQITIKTDGRDGPRDVWFLFESDHADIEDLHAALVEDGSAFGQRVETVHVASGLRRETGRYPFIVSHQIVASVCPPRFDLERAA